MAGGPFKDGPHGRGIGRIIHPRTQAIKTGPLRPSCRPGSHDSVSAHPHGSQLRVLSLRSYVPVASRAWELRDDLTLYDAWYVALAELLDVQVVTLDARLTRAPGPTCRFVLPPTDRLAMLVRTWNDPEALNRVGDLRVVLLSWKP